MKSVRLIISAFFSIIISATSFSQIYVKNNGNVGIGTNNPMRKLHVNGQFYVTGNGNTLRILPDNPGTEIGTTTDKIDFWSSYTGHNKLYAQKYYKTSDSTLKTNIRPLQNSLNTIMKLNTYSYFMKEDKENPIKEYGFLSQEVEKILPEITSRSKEVLMIDYDQIIPILVNAMKEQQKEIDILQKIVHLQETEIIKLKSNEKNITYVPDNNKMNRETALLYNNIPNPVNSETTIKYYIPKLTTAKIIISDLQGKAIKSYQINNPGYGNIKVAYSELHRGIFIYTLIVDNKIIDTKKMLVD